jgi:hypothetical protein
MHADVDTQVQKGRVLRLGVALHSRPDMMPTCNRIA